MTRIIPYLLIICSWLIVLILDQSEASRAHWLFPTIWCLIIQRTQRSGNRNIAYLSYITFLMMSLADAIGFSNENFVALCSYLTVTFSVFFFLCFIRQVQSRSGLRIAPVLNLVSTLALSILPLTFIIHSIDLGATFSKDIVFAIMATNINESIEFGLTHLSFFWVILALTFITVIASLSFNKPTNDQSNQSLARPFILSIVFAILSIVQPENLRLYRDPISAVRQYQREIASFIEVQNKFQLNDAEFTASKHEQGETYVIVIGESLNKDHMSLYGYPRTTTPRLDEHSKSDQFLRFSNAFSSHTHTSESLSLALTEANQINQKKYYKSVSICNILKQAQIESIWITNQSLRGQFDDITSVIAHQADSLISYNHWGGDMVKQSHYDESLLESYSEILAQKSDKTRAIFIHLLGNHWQYKDRYPSRYSIFPLPVETVGPWLNLPHDLQQCVNEYDNSVAYNDYVVGTALTLLQEQGGANAFVYFSDHGEDAYGDAKHNSSNFTLEMIKTPLIVWLSNSYTSRYPDKSAAATDNIHALYCNDAIYDTLIGLLNIETPRYEKSKDLFSRNYRLNPEDAYTLHGRVKIPLDAVRTQHVE